MSAADTMEQALTAWTAAETFPTTVPIIQAAYRTQTAHIWVAARLDRLSRLVQPERARVAVKVCMESTRILQKPRAFSTEGA